MQSMVFKIGAGALAVAALAAIIGAYMPVGIALKPQSERIASSAQNTGASNIGQRDDEADGRRGKSMPLAPSQTTVVLGASDEAEPIASQPAQSAHSNGYSGTAPVPQTVFEGESQPAADAASDSATEPSAEE